ncbi:hypothetical protein R1flu_014580 [Riccia fluitans]|uniref:Uncharacterized protein n=1 Tax=Riccia fluitans TaxID=41844 RepID=A0ABD1YHL6_9MARC
MFEEIEECAVQLLQVYALSSKSRSERQLSCFERTEAALSDLSGQSHLAKLLCCRGSFRLISLLSHSLTR